jgi:hypothetical protein
LDDQLWKLLHQRAHKERTTVSELVRQAVRDQYLGNLEKRREAMDSLVGLWKDRDDLGDSTEYVRDLRRGTRTERLSGGRTD